MKYPGLIDIPAELVADTIDKVIAVRNMHHEAAMKSERWLLEMGVIQEHERLALNQAERAAYWAFRGRRRRLDTG